MRVWRSLVDSLSGGEGSDSFLPWSSCSHLRHRRIGEQFWSENENFLVIATRAICKGSSATKGFGHWENSASLRLLISSFLIRWIPLSYVTRMQIGNIGQATACSARLGMDSHNPHWYSWPCPTGDLHHPQLCPPCPHHRRIHSHIHFHILSTAWFGRSSLNLRQEWPLSEACRSYSPTPFRSSSSSSTSLAASLKASCWLLTEVYWSWSRLWCLVKFRS